MLPGGHAAPIHRADTCLDVFVDADSRVRHGEHHVGAERNHRPLLPIYHANFYIRGFDDQLSALGHRVTSVDRHS